MQEMCTHLKDLVSAELSIIERNIDKHKWLRHIEDKNEAVADFIEKYIWVVREMYCGYVCKDKDNCILAQEFIEKEEKND